MSYTDKNLVDKNSFISLNILLCIALLYNSLLLSDN